MLLLTYVSNIHFPAPHAAMASPQYVKHLPPHAAPKWLDSGGYIALKRDAAPPPPQELCKLCEDVGAEVCFAPDVPPPPDADVITYLGIELRNAVAALSSPCLLAPVVHIHPSPAYSTALKLILRVKEALGAPLIGVGGAVPHLTAHRYALVRARALEALQAAGRIHLFGAGSPTTLARLSLPPSVSVDWAGWSLKASYGKVILPPEIGGGERHVTGKPLHKKYPVLTNQEAEALLRWLEARGFVAPSIGEFIEKLRRSYVYRAQINAIVALKWHQEFHEKLLRHH
jgi:N-acetylglutamate synthase-like GNAT family acetyltransferase